METVSGQLQLQSLGFCLCSKENVPVVGAVFLLRGRSRVTLVPHPHPVRTSPSLSLLVVRLSLAPVTSSRWLPTVCSASCLHLPISCQGFGRRSVGQASEGCEQEKHPSRISGERLGTQNLPSLEGSSRCQEISLLWLRSAPETGPATQPFPSPSGPGSELCSHVPSS